MKQVYQIIKKLQSIPGTNDKIDLLKSHKNNESLKKYLFLVYSDTTHNFYQKKIDKKMFPNLGKQELDIKDFECIAINLSERKISGNAAIEYLAEIYAKVDYEYANLLEWMIKRDIQAKISSKTINKVWPNLIYIQGYCRCSLPKDTNLNKWKWDKGIFVQTKADGMFLNLNIFKNNFEAKSRNGTPLPKDIFYSIFDELKDKIPEDYQFHGELLVYKDKELLSRKVGNGILNSYAQGEPFPKGHSILYVVWDCIPYKDSIKGICNVPYEQRYATLESIVPMESDCIDVIDTVKVFSYNAALTYYKSIIKVGGEGAIIKTPSMIWKNHTSKEQIKLKVEFECELKIVGFKEGQNKYTEMLGSFECVSSDNLLKVNVSGFTDIQRIDFWKNQESLIDKIITVKSNAIIDDISKNEYSLFLPVFQEIRLDKKEANSFK